MAVLDDLFKRYRDRNKRVPSVAPDGNSNNSEKNNDVQEFGINALRKNPNLGIFNNA